MLVSISSQKPLQELCDHIRISTCQCYTSHGIHFALLVCRSHQQGQSMGRSFSTRAQHGWIFQSGDYLDETIDPMEILQVMVISGRRLGRGEYGALHEQQLFSTAILEKLAQKFQSLDDSIYLYSIGRLQVLCVQYVGRIYICGFMARY